MELLKRIAQNVVDGDDEQVAELTARAIEANTVSKRILDDGLIAGMAVVGRRFKEHDIFLPDVLMAAKAMYAGMDKLKPLLIKDGVPPLGKVVLGTIQGDLHDIGKNLVAIMLRGVGFEVCDLGTNVSPEEFVRQVERQRPDIVGISALLTTTMPMMPKVIGALHDADARSSVKVIVGGAPVNQKFADDIGADGYAEDAGAGVDLARALVRG